MTRKIQRVTVTFDVEMEGRPALPRRSDIADALIEGLSGNQIEVGVPDSVGGFKVVDMRVIAGYSTIASEHLRVAPDLKEVRETPKD